MGFGHFLAGEEQAVKEDVKIPIMSMVVVFMLSNFQPGRFPKIPPSTLRCIHNPYLVREGNMISTFVFTYGILKSILYHEVLEFLIDELG